MFGKDKKEDEDLYDDGENLDIDNTKQPRIGEKSEMRLFLFVIVSVLVVLFLLVFLMNFTTVKTINTSTNSTLSGLNISATRTLNVIEINSNQTDARINVLTNQTNSLANVTDKQNRYIDNNTKNIDTLFRYIKNLVETETPKNNQFKENVTSLIKNVSSVVNILEERLANNNTGKITESNQYTKLNNEMNREQSQILKTCKDFQGKIAAVCNVKPDGKGGVIINSNVK